MRKFIRNTRPRSPISLFILPMIDVIFLLLLFFVVMTSFEAGAKIKVDVPRPDQSIAHQPESLTPVVINCERTEDQQGARYRIGGDPPESLEIIGERLAAAKAGNPQLKVVIRADRLMPFVNVRSVMKMVGDNGIELMDLSARRDVGG
ncbi:MAG: biopolymer transporter ExbD [Planctomycetota bacterium]